MILSNPEPLDHLHDFVWQSLRAAASSGRHPWSWGVITTADRDGQPNARTVILRQADEELAIIDFHTDVRSSKIAEMDNPSVAWVFYAESQKIQLRLTGFAKVINGEQADSAWKQTTLRSRSAYVSLASPGSESRGEQPPSTEDRQVNQEESERGREYFRVVRTFVREADLLYLRREGHVRARLNYRDSHATGPKASPSWLVP
ncbi:MAG: pyridoxamine 5'-phosphate oxidase family protein [Planctomycetota bacterium]